MTTHTDLIDSYFQRADGPDPEDYLHLFAPTAVVEDDGHRHTGIDAIRTWRSSTIPARFDVLDVSVGKAATARARISGEFPGSPVVLVHRFEFDGDDRIASLTISPESAT